MAFSFEREGSITQYCSFYILTGGGGEPFLLAAELNFLGYPGSFQIGVFSNLGPV